MDMLAQDLQPASIVEDQDFVKFKTILDPCYEIPSRRSLMRMLPTKYDEVKQRVLQVLVQIRYVSVTTDIWTSRTTEGF